MIKKLQEVIRQMKHGDRFVFSIAGMNPLFCNGENSFAWKGIHGARFNLFEYLSHCDASGEIIRAEPKILTTTQYMDLALSEPGKWENKDIATAYQQGDKNGWNRTNKLRKAVESYLNMYQGDTRAGHPMLVKALRNLTPPWESEK